MSLRNRTLLGLAKVLGMFLPRSGAPVDAPVTDATLAQQLEQANARVRELQERDEEAIQAAADRRLAEIFPDVAVPADESRRPVRSATEVPPEDRGPATIEEQVAALDARVEQLATERDVDELDGRLQRALEKYPEADRSRVLMWIAEAGDREVNVEKMVEVSHNHESRRFEERYAARRAAEGQETRDNAPPRLPTQPGGVNVTGEKITTANAARTLVERMKKALPHWGTGS